MTDPSEGRRHGAFKLNRSLPQWNILLPETGSPPPRIILMCPQGESVHPEEGAEELAAEDHLIIICATL